MLDLATALALAALNLHPPGSALSLKLTNILSYGALRDAPREAMPERRGKHARLLNHLMWEFPHSASFIRESGWFRIRETDSISEEANG